MLNTRPFQEPPERGDLRETVEALLGRHLPADRALAVDRAGAFASAAWEALGQAGLLGLGGDEASGGSGGTVGDAVAVVEEIARVLPSMAVDYVVCGMAMRMLGDGAGAPVAGWMPAIASGAMVCAFGLSEPDVGTDLLSLRTSARVDGDWWVLKGQKLWISLAHEAEVAFVLCRTDPPEGDRKARGLSVIAVPLDRNGSRSAGCTWPACGPPGPARSSSTTRWPRWTTSSAFAGGRCRSWAERWTWSACSPPG